jgi:exosome complex exonuclease RRP6
LQKYTFRIILVANFFDPMAAIDFKKWKEELQRNLVQLTQSVKCIQPSDVPFLRSLPDNAKQLHILSDTLLANINRTIEFSSMQNNVQIFDGIEDVEDRYEIAVETIDNLFEKANYFIDSTKPSTQKLQVNSGTNHFTDTLVKRKYLLRPQLKFPDTIDNSNTPWKPIIFHKPNALKPLQNLETVPAALRTHIQNMSGDYAHPYEYEIQNLEYPNYLFEKSDPLVPKNVDETQFVWIEKKEHLDALVQDLIQQRELAVDLEHHDYRSYQGFSCLVQISTRERDYLIDALALRSELHVLNEAFTNPKIVKVFHGADMDIQWLQRGLNDSSRFWSLCREPFRHVSCLQSAGERKTRICLSSGTLLRCFYE